MFLYRQLEINFPLDYLLNAENTPRFLTALQVKIQFISIWTAT